MRQFSRRGFLTKVGVAGGALIGLPLLAACGSTTAPVQPTNVPAKPPAAANPTTGAATPAAAATKPAAGTTAPAATSQAAKPAAGKEAVVLRFHLRAGTEKTEPSMYVKRPEEWTQETGYQVKLEPIPSGQDYVPKLQALIAGGSAGDLTWASDFRSELTTLVRQGAIEPVDNYLGKYNVSKSEWFPTIVDTMTQNGKMYGMPKAGVPEAGFLFVNLSMFDKAGIKRPETYGTTYEKLAEWAVALAKGPKDRRDVYGYWSPNNYVGGFTTHVFRRGGDVMNEEGTKGLVNTDPWTQFLEWMNKLANDDKVVPLTQDVPSGGITSVFAAEKVAMFLGQRSDVKTLKAAIGTKFEWGVIDDAKKPGVTKGAPISVTTHAGLSGSKFKEETFTLLKAISDKRYAVLVAEENGYLAGRVKNLEEIGDLAKDPFIQLQQRVSAEGSKMWRAGNLRAYEVETAVVNTLDLLWLGKRQLDKAYVADLQKSMDEVLQKP